MNWEPDPVNPATRVLMNFVIVNDVTGEGVNGANIGVADLTRGVVRRVTVDAGRRLFDRRDRRDRIDVATGRNGQLGSPLRITLNRELRVAEQHEIRVTVTHDDYDEIACSVRINFDPRIVNETEPRSLRFGPLFQDRPEDGEIFWE